MHKKKIITERHMTRLLSRLAMLAELFISDPIVLEHLLPDARQYTDHRLDRVGHTVIGPRDQMELRELVLGEERRGCLARRRRRRMVVMIVIVVVVMVIVVVEG